MIIEIKVPALSESVAEATLLSWHKKIGESINRDENLIDIETDKVVLELPSPDDGVLIEVIKNDGDTVIAGEVIAKIDTEAKIKSGAKNANSNGQTSDTQISNTSEPEKILMPAAAKIAREKNIDVNKIEGSGKAGRITKEDILKTDSNSTKEKSSVAGNAVVTGERGEQRVPMSRLRKRIAERLIESQSTAAILSTFNEVNMGPVIQLRKKYKEQFEKAHGVKLGFMSFFVKAALMALQKFPIINSSIDGDDIIYHSFYDIGIAVGSPRGLVVPVLRNVDSLSFANIEKQISDFGKKANEGKLSIEELTGGTFSISNGGVFGSMLSTPIINPPQSAILGIHATKDRAVVENGEIVVRPMNYLALSYDHRIIDGREAVLFLVAIKDALEDPSRMLLEL
ncbi:MAG: 2-oxoglutarate dehydrogenase complex dihydrolipoyllysine-residue succinyltransferase [Hydrogenophilales bacterium]